MKRKGIRIIGGGQWGNHLGQLLFAVRFAEVHQCTVTFFVDWLYYRTLKDIFTHPQVKLIYKPLPVYYLTRNLLKVRYRPDEILNNPRFGKYYCVYGHSSSHGWTLDELRAKIRAIFPTLDYQKRQEAIFVHYRSFMLQPYYDSIGIDSSVIITFLHHLYDKYKLPIRLFMDFSSRSSAETPDTQLHQRITDLPFVETNNPDSALLDDWKLLFEAKHLVATSGSSFSLLPAIMNPNPVHLIGPVEGWQIYKLIGAEFVDIAAIADSSTEC